jgi:preprotein translocase subunit SecA
MARIKTRSVLLEQGVVSADEAKALPPSPDKDYYPCEIDDGVVDMLKGAADSIKASFGSDLQGIELDELLTVAFDTTEAEDDPDHIVKMRDAAELYVMGTNRHESSRIDQQLRGRAGRQGDSGSSRFFLSFEDDMFVIFGGDQLQKLLAAFRVSNDMPVEAPQVTEALDKVQGVVEEKYREIRKEIFNFDETVNTQRRVIYSRRQSILYSSPKESLTMMKDYNRKTVESIVRAQTDSKGAVNVEKVMEKVAQFFPPVVQLLDESALNGLDQEEVAQYIGVAVDEFFASKMSSMPNLGRSSNYITLVSMDNAWSDHLQGMENLKESVLLLKYQGRDTIAEYQMIQTTTLSFFCAA